MGRASLKKELQLIHTAATHSHSCNSFAQMQLIRTAATHLHSCNSFAQQIWDMTHSYVSRASSNKSATHSCRCNSLTQVQLIHTTATHSHSCNSVEQHMQDMTRSYCESYLIQKDLLPIHTAATHSHSCNASTQLQLIHTAATRILQSYYTYKQVVSHIWVSHVTYTRTSQVTHARVMSHI